MRSIFVVLYDVILEEFSVRVYIFIHKAIRFFFFGKSPESLRKIRVIYRRVNPGPSPRLRFLLRESIRFSAEGCSRIAMKKRRNLFKCLPFVGQRLPFRD